MECIFCGQKSDVEICKDCDKLINIVTYGSSLNKNTVEELVDRVRNRK